MQAAASPYSQSGARRAARQGCRAWNAAKAPRKAKVTKLLESTDLFWVLSARSAEIFEFHLRSASL